MDERVLRIGKPVPLSAVATEPAQFDARKPAMILLNSGVMHHVGSCRLSVIVARAVAQQGLLAVRYDASGIGDSEARQGSLSTVQLALNETREVMDYLEKTRGINRFILFGLCSGARASYATALADPRVVGTVKIDTYCYPTRQYYLRYYLPRLLNGQRWKSFLRRMFASVLGRQVQKTAESVSGIGAEYLEVPVFDARPPREELAKGLQKLVERQVKSYVIYTGGEAEYNYPGQYLDMFPEVDFKNTLKLEYFPMANHIITQRDCQKQVVNNIAQWVTGFA